MENHSSHSGRTKQYISYDKATSPIQSMQENNPSPVAVNDIPKTIWNNGTTEICSKNCFLYLNQIQMLEVLENNIYCNVGTVSASGNPHISTAMYSYDFKEDTLLFCMMINSDCQTYDNIKFNPNINIYIMESYRQKHRKNSFRTISAQGRAIISNDTASQNFINKSVVSRNKTCKMYMDGCMCSESTVYINVEISSVVGKHIIF